MKDTSPKKAWWATKITTTEKFKVVDLLNSKLETHEIDMVSSNCLKISAEMAIEHLSIEDPKWLHMRDGLR